jgi:integral membrane sensor domain MASE1
MSVRWRAVLAVTGGFGRSALAVLLVAAAYYAGGVAGTVLGAPPSRISILWPPNAILLAALLVSPTRLWPWYLIAALPAHLHVTWQFGADPSIVTTVNRYIGNSTQALLAAFLVTRVSKQPPRMDDFRGAGVFILLAALVAPGVASALSAYLHTLTGWVSNFWLAWQQRTLGNVVTTLTLTPFIVLTFSNGIHGLRRTSARRLIEAGVLMLAVLAVALAIFGWRSAGHQAMPALLYALLPLLLWAAVRFPPVCLFACLVLVVTVSLVSAHYGRGPFLTLSQTVNVMALQLFLIAISVPLILLTALVQEHARTARALLDSQKRYSMATAAGSVSVWDWHLMTGEFYLDPSLKAMLGFQDHEIENTLDDWMRHLHPDDNAHVLAQVEAHVAGTAPVFEAEHRALRKDGTILWLLCRGVAAEHANGVPVRITGTSIESRTA